MAQLLVKMDIDADIIEVPQFVIDNKERLRLRFLRWLYNRFNRHKYWVKKPSGFGYYGVCYRSDAFVEWLNLKVLNKCDEKAFVVREHIAFEDCNDSLPSIFF